MTADAFAAAGWTARRLGVVMAPDPDDPREALGVCNPGAARGLDGELYLFPRLVAEGRLRAATWDGADAMRDADAVVVIVPVVVDAERQIDYGPIDAATRDIARRIGPGVLVVYETTLPVGTTRSRFGPMLVEGSGLELDRDLFLAFSPERVLVGRVFVDLQRYPKIVGATSDESSHDEGGGC